MKTLRPETFLTLSEVARRGGVPVSRISKLISAGELVPAGKAGCNLNSAIVFRASDVDAVLAALGGHRAALRAHVCKSPGEVMAKHAALVRATASEEAA